MSTYTPSPRQSSNPTLYQPTNFGSLRNDANKRQLDYSNVIQTLDATATPVTSPVAVNTTATLTVPPDAVSVTLCSVTNGIRVSEDSAYTVYFNLPAATPFTFNCADQAFIYLQSASGSTTVSFLFNIV